MSEFTIDIPDSDIKALTNAISRMSSEVGKSNQASTRMAAKQVLKSAGAITRRAPLYRKYKRMGLSKSKKQIFEVDMSHAPKSLKAHAAKNGLLSGNSVMLIASSVSELKKSGYVKIGARGLAKVSWQIIGKRGNHGDVSGGIKVTQTARNKSTAQKYTSYEERHSGENNYIRMSNNLEYIRDAIEGGIGAMNNIIGKAARGLEKTIDNILTKQAKAV